MAMLCIPLVITGQTIKGNEDSGTVGVSGTSSLHDWEMKLVKFDVSANLEKNDDGSYTLNDASFLTEAKHLTSEKSMMENKAHDALKSEDHPEIAFHQTKGNISISPTDNNFQIRGDLTIAGQTRPIVVKLNGKFNEADQFQVTGNTSLKMTDFDIKPPKVMLGAIKTNDEVSIELDLTLKSN